MFEVFVIGLQRSIFPFLSTFLLPSDSPSEHVIAHSDYSSLNTSVIFLFNLSRTVLAELYLL